MLGALEPNDNNAVCEGMCNLLKRASKYLILSAYRFHRDSISIE